MQKTKGFTIIELLVVIAIIAVLASIVLVNVSNYISKGKDAAAKGNLSTLLTNGAVFFDSGDTYADFNLSAGYTSVTSSLSTAGYTTTYTGNDTNWCASVPMKAIGGKTFCVDSSGKKTESTNSTCADQACPN